MFDQRRSYHGNVQQRSRVPGRDGSPGRGHGQGNQGRIGELVDGLTAACKESIADKIDEANANEHIDGVDVKIKFGRIRETIMDDIIFPLHPDLVICGARGLSSFKYALLGSVSTFLVRQCPCDLLVVKQKMDD